MDLISIGIIGIVIMLALVAIGVPIAFAMASVGIVGTIYVAGFSNALSQVVLITWDKGTDFLISCIPLFVLMGQVAFFTGIAAELYDCLHKWLGRVKGGLAISSVAACGLFGAMTGSSVACVATMGSIIMPEMRKYKYDVRLATGALAASGTLGILIPPSMSFVFYGILTDTSIADLFIAGIIPGIITIFIFSGIIYLRCWLNPALGPLGPRYGWKERFISLRLVMPAVICFIVVVGGLYGGLFTPTEGAGAGAAAVFIISLIMKRLTWDRFKRSVHETGLISSMIFLIIVGGFTIARFLALTGVTEYLIEYFIKLNLNPYVFILFCIVLYFILGCVLDVFGMIILTLPFVFPIVVKLGFDPIWFGVFITIMTEVALITPPIGVNIFVMASIAPDVPMVQIFRGAAPFVVGELILIALIIAYPQIAIWLPYATK